LILACGLSAQGPDPKTLAATVRAAGRGAPYLFLRDGQKVVTRYAGSFPYGQARPLTLASADFDEDGMPDLASGYAAPDGTGIVTLHRGNVDALWPYGSALRNGEPPAFLPDARVFSLPAAPDFLGAGDFDADGHWDLVAASLGGKVLYLLRGDGHGGFSAPEAIALPGMVTAFTTGEVNRPDGLTDIAIGVTGDGGAQVLVFESPRGALRAEPETFAMPAAVTALAILPLDEGNYHGLAVGVGRDLISIHGRDRRLSHSQAVRESVPPAEITRQALPFAVRALAAGRFTSATLLDLAALGDDGRIHFLERLDADYQAARAALPAALPGVNGLPGPMRPGVRNAPVLPDKPQTKELVVRSEVAVPSVLDEATRLVTAHTSVTGGDDVIAIDGAGNRLHVVSRASRGAGAMRLAASLDSDDAPAAVLPMRMTPSALDGLVVLHRGHAEPSAVAHTQSASYTVTTTQDAGPVGQSAVNTALPGSLRWAISMATNVPQASTIDFNIPTSDPNYNSTTGTFTITPLPTTAGNCATAPSQSNICQGLPTLPNGTVLDGYSQTGASPNTLANGGNAAIKIVISGAAAGPGPYGIWVIGGDCTVRGLDLIGFQAVIVTQPAAAYGGAGIELESANNIVEGIISGIDTTSNTPIPNYGGIVSHGGPNTVGGTTPQARNLLTGNNYANFSAVSDSSPTPFFVQGNYAGTDRTGTVSISSGGAGILNAGIGMIIGGTSAGAGNLASGNTFTNGISLARGPGNNFTPDFNLVQGNLVGTDVTGTVALANGSGITVFDGASNQVGGTTAAARNVVAGNSGDGVPISSAATLTTIQGNYIGVDVSGAKALGNGIDGIDQYALSTGISADGTLIGGDIPGAGNVISGNSFNGISFGAYVQLVYNGTTGQSVLGNLIGTDATGTKAMGNGYNGIVIGQGGGLVTIGGTDSGAGNVIGFNGYSGVSIDSNSGQGYVNTVIGNSILSNHNAGISLLAGVGDKFSRNSIYSNGALGIDIGNPNSAANSCQTTATGPNNSQNAPVLTPASGGATLVSATAIDASGNTSQFSNCAAMANTGNVLNIAGSLNSLPNATYTVEFFQNAACDPSGSGQGQTFLNSISVKTGANCIATFGDSVNIATADLSVVLTDVSPIPNSNTVYTATVLNGGGASAANVVFTDTLPASETFVSVTTSQGACGNSGNAITCNLGTMKCGATGTIAITAYINAIGNISDTATVSSSTADPNTANNSFTLTIDAAAQLPTLDHLSPTAEIAGVGAIPLVIAGTNFYPGVTTVTANGTTVAANAIALTPVVTNDQICGPPYALTPCQGLVVTIPASLTAATGTVTITITNPNSFNYTASANLSIYPSPGNAATFQITGIPATVAPGTNYSMKVTALDANGNVATGYQGTAILSETFSQATFTPSSPYRFTPADNGSHTFSVTFVSSSIGYSITVADAAIPTISASIGAVAAAGPPTILSPSGVPDNAPIGFPFDAAFSVTLQDANYVNVVGATVTFTVPSSGASGTFSNGQTSIQVQTDSGGTASASLTANQIAGPFHVTATVGTLSYTWTVTSTANVPAHLVVVSGNNQSIQVDTGLLNPLPTQLVEVAVTDAQNNPVPNVVVTFSAPASGPSVNFPLATALAETNKAVAILEGPLVANGILGSYTVTASLGSLSTGISFTNTSGPNPVTGLLGGGVLQAAAINTKFANPLPVQPTDANGNCLAQVPVTFTVPASGPSAILSASTVKSDPVTCVAQVTATANGVTGGPYNVTASAPGVSPVTFQLRNDPTGLGSLSPTGGTPQSATVGKAFATPLRVFGQDGNSNALESQPITFTEPTSGASAVLSSSTVLCDLNGVATITATANNIPGSYVVTARYGSLTASFSLTNVQPVATTLLATGGTTQAAPAGTAFASALQATVLDQSGNPLSGVTVTFTSPATGAGATFSSQTAVTNSSGVASVTATANGSAGSYLVTASSGALSASFSLSNTAGAPASLTPIGTPQATQVGTRFAVPLQVVVKNAGGNPLSGITVNFAAPASTATSTLSAANAVSNSSGIASVTATANSGVGGYTVTATAGSLSAQFSLTNTALSPCDVNQDTVTNVQDVQKMVNEGLGTASATNDLNGDGVVNVVDIQLVIDAVLNFGCAVQ